MHPLITGAGGTVGWALMQRLVDRGCDVRLLLRTAARQRGGVVALLRSRGVEVVEGDLADREALRAAVEGRDVIFHLAWQSSPGSDPDCINGTPEASFEANLAGVQAVLDAAGAVKVRRLVFPSTTSVYGTAAMGGGAPLDENAEVIDPQPIPQRHWHNFAAIKLLAERLIAGTPGIEGVILRAPPIYGPYQRATLAMLWQMLGAPGQGVFSHTLQWIHRDDIVDALIRAAEAPALARPIVNVAGGRAASSDAIAEAVRTIADCLYKRLALPDIDGMIPPTTPAFDIAKARTALGFSPQVPWSRGLVETVAQALYGDARHAPTATTTPSTERKAHAAPHVMLQPGTSSTADPLLQAADPAALAGLITVVTGATAGIGRALSLKLAEIGAHVIAVGRHRERGDSLAAAAASRGLMGSIEFIAADLADQRQIWQLANGIERRQTRLDILINNAGAIFGTRQVSCDGIEMTFAVNHMAPFILTNLLVPLLQKSPSGRILNISAQAHQGVEIDFSDLQHERSFEPLVVYRRSKLANLLVTYHLARLLVGTHLTINAAHPGSVTTDIGLSNNWMSPSQWQRMLANTISPQESCARLLNILTADEYAGVSGQYFSNGVPAQSSPPSYDVDAGVRMWNESEALAGIIADSS